jgi:hypothetical protein
VKNNLIKKTSEHALGETSSRASTLSIKPTSYTTVLGQFEMQKVDSINFFYDILQDLENKVGGCKRLSECHGDMKWPQRGVYFFFERGEMRT